MSEWENQKTADALARVDRFMAEAGGMTRQGVEQPARGATNRTVFARQGDRIIVFKVFCEPERKERECFGIHHWKETGLTPKLIFDIDSTMIAMSHVPGRGLTESRRSNGEVRWRQACRGVGRAAGSLAAFPISEADIAAFESRFYRGIESVEKYLGRIVELGRGVCKRDRDFSGRYWSENLDFIESRLEAIYRQPRVLYHQDVSNLHVEQGRFTGFFDLEMCRVGCPALQLGSVLGMLDNTDGHAWTQFKLGWTESRGQLEESDVESALAAAFLLGWRVITRYLSYDGSAGSGFDWASPADPSEYQRGFESLKRMVRM
jgi:hypothetical protein